MESTYQVKKPGKNYQIIDLSDSDKYPENIEEAHKAKTLARKIFENPELNEAYELGNLKFSEIDLDDQNITEIKDELDRLIYQERKSLVEEYDRDN